MIAALPMYDQAETAAANDRLWAATRAALGHGPDSLTRGGDVWQVWLSPRLLLAQTCGYPYRARLHGRVQLVGTPDYGLPGCAPGNYHSVFVTRAGDSTDLASYRHRRFAYNEALSQSGWAAAQSHAAGLGFAFADLVQTGAHRESARAVAGGRADIAALDALSWKMMLQYDDFAGNLQVIASTEPTPALPFITAPGNDADAVYTALETAIAALSPDDRGLLHLRGLVRLPEAAYLAVPTPPGP